MNATGPIFSFLEDLFNISYSLPKTGKTFKNFSMHNISVLQALSWDHMNIDEPPMAYWSHLAFILELASWLFTMVFDSSQHAQRSACAFSVGCYVSCTIFISVPSWVSSDGSFSRGGLFKTLSYLQIALGSAGLWIPSASKLARL